MLDFFAQVFQLLTLTLPALKQHMYTSDRGWFFPDVADYELFGGDDLDPSTDEKYKLTKPM